MGLAVPECLPTLASKVYMCEYWCIYINPPSTYIPRYTTASTYIITTYLILFSIVFRTYIVSDEVVDHLYCFARNLSEDCSFYCMVTVMVVLRVDVGMVIAYTRCPPEKDNNILQGLTTGDVSNIRPEDLSNFFRVNHNSVYYLRAIRHSCSIDIILLNTHHTLEFGCIIRVFVPRTVVESRRQSE